MKIEKPKNENYCATVKSPKFLEHETQILDSGTEDLESSQNQDEK
jgi:hypothetical protein